MSGYFAYPTAGTDDGDAGFAFLPRRPAQDWERIARHAERLRFGPGDLLVRRGEDDRSFYIVLRPAPRGADDASGSDRDGFGLRRGRVPRRPLALGRRPPGRGDPARLLGRVGRPRLC